MQDHRQAAALEGGFRDAPRTAAHAFRALMKAMARPGTIEMLTGACPPAPLSIAAGTALLTLSDADTPVHLAGAMDCAPVRHWLAFHTSAPLSTPAQAMFAVGHWADLLPLDAYAIGAPDYPDRSATLIVDGADLTAKGTRLSGPGIKDHTTLALPDADLLAQNNRLYPLGLDFYFTSGAQIAALPRSTRIG